jgi:hypothetical protein
VPAALFEEWDMYGKFCEIYAGSVAIVTKATGALEEISLNCMILRICRLDLVRKS